MGSKGRGGPVPDEGVGNVCVCPESVRAMVFALQRKTFGETKADF